MPNGFSVWSALKRDGLMRDAAIKPLNRAYNERSERLLTAHNWLSVVMGCGHRCRDIAR
jgi:hypothetical protein